MLPTCSDRELAFSDELRDRDTMVGNLTRTVRVRGKLGFVEAECCRELLQGVHGGLGHEPIIFAVEQPDPAAGQVSGIINEALLMSLPDKLERYRRMLVTVG